MQVIQINLKTEYLIGLAMFIAAPGKTIREANCVHIKRHNEDLREMPDFSDDIPVALDAFIGKTFTDALHGKCEVLPPVPNSTLPRFRALETGGVYGISLEDLRTIFTI